MDEDDEFGDLYSDVLQPFQPPPAVLPPPPPPPHRSIDLNLRSEDQDVAEANSASFARVSDNDASKLPTAPSQDANRQGGGDDKDMSFDIEEPDADSKPAIPGLFVSASEAAALPGLATDRGVTQGRAKIEQVGDGGYGGQGEGDDWDSDSEDDLQIVLNDNNRNVMIGADRRSRMGNNEDDDDDDDDEEALVIVADNDPNQPMEEQMWGEDGLQAVDGDGKDGGEAGKGSGPGGAACPPPKAGYSSHGYHPFHSQFKVSVNAALLSLVRLLSSRGSCRGPVLAFINSELHISFVLVPKPECKCRVCLPEKFGLTISLLSCFSLFFCSKPISGCLVITFKNVKGDKNLNHSLFITILCGHKLRCPGVVVKFNLCN